MSDSLGMSHFVKFFFKFRYLRFMDMNVLFVVYVVL